MNDPAFSVVIPLYNHEAYIEAAILSVVEQTCHPHELIIVDDGSSDAGYDIACQAISTIPCAKIVRQENSGAHNAINRAIGMATGTHVAVLNSDDLFKITKLERCQRLIRAHPDAGLIFGRVEIIDSHGRFTENSETTQWLDRCYAYLRRCENLTLALMNENFGVTTSNFVFRRDLWVRAGGFQDLRYCHDLDFLMAASRYSSLLFDEHGGAHISYRVHPQNTIKETIEKVRLEISAVLAAALGGDALHVSDRSPDIFAREIENMLRTKELGEKVASLIPFVRNFDERSGLYSEISGNRLHSNQFKDCSCPNSEDRERGHNAGLGVAKTQGSEGGEAVAVKAAHPHPVANGPRTIVAAIELANFDKGGLEKVVLDCAIGFRECGVDPIIISKGKIGHLGSIARQHGIETIKLPVDGAALFYEKILKDRKVDIAMSHFSNLGYEIFRKLRIPNITFIHNIYAMLNGKALDDFLESERYVDRYISVSNLATDYVVEKYGFDRRKIDTIPNGLILSEHRKRIQMPAANRSDFDLSQDDYVFLNVASYNLHKAHYLMADAMKLILKSRKNIKILCVGNTVFQPHIDQFREDLRHWGLDKHILLPGYYEDVAPLHKMADAFLLPSFIEGWSIAMNEAMFYSKPMILSETGGAPEVIEGSDIGILVPNEYGSVINLDSRTLDQIGYEKRRFSTAPYLANAMMQFADNRQLWQAKGKIAHKKVVNNFDFRDVMERYVATCLKVLAC